jgi:hypothetical protein
MGQKPEPLELSETRFSFDVPDCPIMAAKIKVDISMMRTLFPVIAV